MPTRALPAGAQTQLEHVLADTERGLIAAESLTMTVEPERAGDLIFLHPTDRRADEQLRLALAAAAQIATIIGALDWPAADRRQTVAVWHERVRRLCGLDRPQFRAARRQPWWDAFQQGLQRPDAVRRRPRRAAPPPLEVLSFGQQLTRAMALNHVGVKWMVAETARLQQAVGKRTIERLMADEQQPQPATIGALTAALTTAQHGVPFHFQRPAK